MRIFALSYLLFLPILLVGQFSQALASTEPLFSVGKPLKMTLKYNIALLQSDKDSLRETGLPGTVVVDGNSLQIMVMPRGQGSFLCKQPQLKLDFRKAQTANTPFKGFGKIKLFTSGRCIDNHESAEQDKTILGNYLIYKLNELVFPDHFKTRLVEITYIDAGGKFKNYSQLAFFIEPEKHVENRLQVKHVEAEELLKLANTIPELVDSSSVRKMHAFQFFIGNLDYGIPGFFSHILSGTYNMEKNIQLFRNADGKFVPIAFDFDFSRLNYAGPICSVSSKFFMDGQFLSTCSVLDLESIYKSDLSKFQYKKEVSDHFSTLKQAFHEWQKIYKDELSRFGLLHTQNLAVFLAAFESAVQKQ